MLFQSKISQLRALRTTLVMNRQKNLQVLFALRFFSFFIASSLLRFSSFYFSLFFLLLFILFTSLYSFYFSLFSLLFSLLFTFFTTFLLFYFFVKYFRISRDAAMKITIPIAMYCAFAFTPRYCSAVFKSSSTATPIKALETFPRPPVTDTPPSAHAAMAYIS